MKPGVAIMIVDFFVIVGTGLVIHWKGVSEKPILFLILYALFQLFLSSVILDKIVYGIDYAKNLMIFSDKNTEISDFIIHKLDRSATVFYARGAYKGNDKEVLMTVVSPSEARELTPFIQSIDPKAFMVLSNVHEVLGEGFRTREDVDIKFINNVKKQEDAQKAAAEAAKNAILAEVVAERAQEKANAAKQHAETFSDDGSHERAEAHNKAKIAAETASIAKQNAIDARELADKLEEEASNIHEIIQE